jgi:hypothetical protein
MGFLLRRRVALVAIAPIALVGAIELLKGRPPICPCGTIRLWQGAVQSPENSQQIADWYSFSHIIHGFLFYGAGYLAFRDRPALRAWALPLAVLVEGGWELLENSPLIIDRYREATMALGYSGDSVLNSLCDIGWMAFGFWVAARLPPWWTVALAIGFELMTLAIIRDNLTLNVLMLIAPVAAIKVWQSG